MFNLSGNKELKLTDGSSIKYELIKKSRRTVGLKITPKGLIVIAPILMSYNKIEKLLIKKSSWIQKKLLLIPKDTKPFQIRDGEKFEIFGNEYMIVLCSGKNNIIIEKNKCLIYFKNLSDQLKLKKFFLVWIKEYALKYYSKRVSTLCKINNFDTRAILISNAKTRWGTCNSKKEIRLNWRLIQSPKYIIDYVICHELSHLKFMNHSKEFWEQVEKLFPNYKKAEIFLRDNGFKLYKLD